MKKTEIVVFLSLEEANEVVTSIEDLGLYRLDDDEKEEALYNEDGLLPKEVELQDKISKAIQDHLNQKE